MGVITGKDVIGWGYRACCLSRTCWRRSELFKGRRGMELPRESVSKSISTFNTWEEFGRSYIIGRSFWAYSPEVRDVLGFCNVVKWLMKHPESPWVKVKLK